MLQRNAKQAKKRIWSLLLVIVMLISLLPATVLADEAEEDLVSTPWEEENALPTEAGNYYLTKNVTLTETWAVTADTVLDLNGMTVALDTETASLSCAISIAAGVTFTLCDSVGGGLVTDGVGTTAGCIYVPVGGTFLMNGGRVLGNNSVNGCAVYVEVINSSSGTFTMYGGSTGGTWGGIDWSFDVLDEAGNGTLTVQATAADPDTLASRWSYPPTWDDETLPATYRVGEWPAATDPTVTYNYWPYDSHRDQITDLVIKEGVITCGAWVCYAFSNCSGDLYFPASVEYLGTEAFNSSGFTSVTFAEGSKLKCLAAGAFKRVKMETIELPEGLECIHVWVFQNCKQLKHVTIPASVTAVKGRKHDDYNPATNSSGGESSIFADCDVLTTVTFEDPADMAQYLSTGYGMYNRDNLQAINGGTFYSSLQDALDSAEAGDTVTAVDLRKPFSTSDNITVPEGVTLNLNGMTLTSSGTLANFGTISGAGGLTNKGTLANFGTIEGEGNFTNSGGIYAATEDAVVPEGFPLESVGTPYRITYHLDGGKATPNNPRAYLETTADFRLNNPTRKGYAFAGWTGTGLGDEIATGLIIVSGSAGDREYTATWTANTYSIHFDANGGEGTMEDMTGVTYDVASALTANAFTCEGYVFAGWNTKADGTGTRYANKASVLNLTDENEGTVTLYAMWEEPAPVPEFEFVMPAFTVTAPAGVAVTPALPYPGSTVTVTVSPFALFDGIQVTDETGAIVRVNGENGVYTFTMPAKSVRISGFVNPFADLQKDSYFYNAALWAYANNITSGTTAVTFSADATCTRAQVVAFLWRAAGCPEPLASWSSFSDVQEDDYYFKAVLWAVQNGITFGTGNDTFSPDAACTRAQVMAFLWRALGADKAIAENGFADVQEDAYYKDAVLWAVENGVTFGTGNDTFSPNADCSRGQIVSFLYRCYSK